ncbi:MAG TPA: Dabb family protein [Planctomycetota bacterium]|nr:Dabb family protein [Planctomycetota bacterium]
MKALKALLCVAALVVGLWLATRPGGAAEPKGSPGTIVHCVFFWFKETATKADIEAMLRDGKEMLAPLPCVKGFSTGTPLTQERGAPVDSSYHVGVTMCFEDAKAYETYGKHPDHLKLIEKHKPLWEKIVVYDFVRQ